MQAVAGAYPRHKQAVTVATIHLVFHVILRSWPEKSFPKMWFNQSSPSAPKALQELSQIAKHKTEALPPGPCIT